MTSAADVQALTEENSPTINTFLRGDLGKNEEAAKIEETAISHRSIPSQVAKQREDKILINQPIEA